MKTATIELTEKEAVTVRDALSRTAYDLRGRTSPSWYGAKEAEMYLESLAEKFRDLTIRIRREDE